MMFARAVAPDFIRECPYQKGFYEMNNMRVPRSIMVFGLPGRYNFTYQFHEDRSLFLIVTGKFLHYKNK